MNSKRVKRPRGAPPTKRTEGLNGWVLDAKHLIGKGYLSKGPIGDHMYDITAGII